MLNHLLTYSLLLTCIHLSTACTSPQGASQKSIDGTTVHTIDVFATEVWDDCRVVEDTVHCRIPDNNEYPGLRCKTDFWGLGSTYCQVPQLHAQNGKLDNVTAMDPETCREELRAMLDTEHVPVCGLQVRPSKGPWEGPAFANDSYSAEVLTLRMRLDPYAVVEAAGLNSDDVNKALEHMVDLRLVSQRANKNTPPWQHLANPSRRPEGTGSYGAASAIGAVALVFPYGGTASQLTAASVSFESLLSTGVGGVLGELAWAFRAASAAVPNVVVKAVFGTAALATESASIPIGGRAELIPTAKSFDVHSNIEHLGTATTIEEAMDMAALASLAAATWEAPSKNLDDLNNMDAVWQKLTAPASGTASLRFLEDGTVANAPNLEYLKVDDTNINGRNNQHCRKGGVGVYGFCSTLKKNEQMDPLLNNLFCLGRAQLFFIGCNLSTRLVYVSNSPSGTGKIIHKVEQHGFRSVPQRKNISPNSITGCHMGEYFCGTGSVITADRDRSCATGAMVCENTDYEYLKR